MNTMNTNVTTLESSYIYVDTLYAFMRISVCKYDIFWNIQGGA
jgi:hypothetical protein